MRRQCLTGGTHWVPKWTDIGTAMIDTRLDAAAVAASLLGKGLSATSLYRPTSIGFARYALPFTSATNDGVVLAVGSTSRWYKLAASGAASHTSQRPARCLTAANVGWSTS